MRVLWFGDFAPTGFGTVTRNIGRRLVALGLDVRFVSQNDTHDPLPDWLVPRAVMLNSLRSDEPFNRLFDGSSTALLYDGQAYAGWKPDAAVLLGDFAASRIIAGQFLDSFRSVPSYHYCPIEGVDLPPAWKEMWDVLSPIAMSEFGADQIEKVTGTRPPMIYHGVDPTEFYPISEDHPITIEPSDSAAQPLVLRTKLDCKKAWMAYFQIIRAPMVWMLRTDSHWPRKRYNEMILSLASVLRDRHDAALVIHTRAYGPGGYLPDTLSKIPDLKPWRVKIPGMPDDAQPAVYGFEGRDSPSYLVTNTMGLTLPVLCSLYNAADMYLSNSAEGFGLTIAEGMACGLPVIGLKYSSVPEVIGDAGITVPTSTLLHNEYDHYWASANQKKYAMEVERMIKNPEQRRMLGERGPERVARLFDWDHKAEQFRAILEAPVQETAWQPSLQLSRSATT